MRILLTIAMASGFATAASAVASDFEVQSSTVEAYTAGQKLAKGTAISLPDGAKLVLIDRTGSAVRTRNCTGRYEGPVETCPARPRPDSKHIGGAVRAAPPPLVPK